MQSGLPLCTQRVGSHSSTAVHGAISRGIGFQSLRVQALLGFVAVLVGCAIPVWGQPNQWTWVGGNSVIGPQNMFYGLNDWNSYTYGYGGVAGAQGVAANGNIPSTRDGGATWTGADGNLWLFGGAGWDDSKGVGPLNDLWMYDVSAGQ